MYINVLRLFQITRYSEIPRLTLWIRDSLQVSFRWIYPLHRENENYSGQAALRKINIVLYTLHSLTHFCAIVILWAGKVNFLACGEVVAVIRSRKVASFVKYNPEW